VASIFRVEKLCKIYIGRGIIKSNFYYPYEKQMSMSFSKFGFSLPNCKKHVVFKITIKMNTLLLNVSTPMV
jgi:hypothetical protein